MAPTGHCGNAQIPLGLTIAYPYVGYWDGIDAGQTMPKSNTLSASSRCRTLDGWARAILRLRIEGTTICSRKVRGFAFGSGYGLCCRGDSPAIRLGEIESSSSNRIRILQVQSPPSNGAERFMSAHTNRSTATTEATVLGGRWRIDWPLTKSRDMTR